MFIYMYMYILEKVCQRRNAVDAHCKEKLRPYTKAL